MRDPGFQISVIVRIRIGGNVQAAGNVRQIGRYSSAGQCTAKLMTHGAWSRHEYLFAAPGRISCRLVGRLQLTLNPCFVIRGLLRDYDEPHMSVLSAAIFGAGAGENAFVIRLDADEVGMLGNRIDLAMKRGNPERMDYVERAQFDIDGLADRNVELVGGRKALRRSTKVLDFPPPLPANNCNRGMQVLMVHVMNWETSHQFRTQNEEHAEHAQRKCKATPCSPALAATNVDWLMLGQVRGVRDVAHVIRIHMNAVMARKRNSIARKDVRSSRRLDRTNKAWTAISGIPRAVTTTLGHRLSSWLVLLRRWLRGDG